MDAATLSRAMGGTVSAARYAQLAPAFNAAMIQAGCTTVNRAAMWCAQLAHESVGLKYMNEIASGDAYEGRKSLGNTQRGDGRRFKGHGPIQITGRSNHTAVSRWAFDHGYVPSPTYFVDHPEQLGDDRYGFLGACWYWTVARPKLNAYSDAQDVRAATLAINGGVNGLAARTERWRACLRLGDALLPSGGPAPTAAPPPPPPVRRPRGDDMPLIYTPEPAQTAEKWDWPTQRIPVSFDPPGGWGGRVLVKVDHGGRGGWIHLLRWWVRDRNWSPNVPLHYSVDVPVGASRGHAGSERFVGYGWQAEPPAGADMLEVVTSAPDGVTFGPFYQL